MIMAASKRYLGTRVSVHFWSLHRVIPG